MNLTVKTLVVDLLRFPFEGHVSIPIPLAQEIKNEDAEELFCHIELTGKSAELWKIEDWRLSEKRFKSEKQMADIRRKEWNIRASNIKILAHALSIFLGMSEEECSSLAEIQITKCKSNPKLMDQLSNKFNIKFEIL